jgi:uncharacterized tellurite resistance protein B-like protein
MIDRLKALFHECAGPSRHEPRAGGHDPSQLACAALLVESATADNHFDATERARIRELIETRFELPPAAAASLLAEAERVVGESAQILRFTRAVKDNLEYDDRVALIEMLWEVVYADGVADALENQLMRRVAGLIYVSDRDSGIARRRVLMRREGNRRATA